MLRRVMVCVRPFENEALFFVTGVVLLFLRRLYPFLGDRVVGAEVDADAFVVLDELRRFMGMVVCITILP